MSLRWTEARKLRILDFDSESRPLSYWYDGACTADVTAIAWSWVGQTTVHVALNSDVESQRVMFERFCEAYRKADVVTAHNCRRFDLPLLQGALAELEMPLLGPKLASDTLKDIPRWKDLPKSQENLCQMLDIPAEKKHMSQVSWREANRLTPEGLKKTKARVRKDVIQHKILRERLLELGWLGPPKVWTP